MIHSGLSTEGKDELAIWPPRPLRIVPVLPLLANSHVGFPLRPAAPYN